MEWTEESCLNLIELYRNSTLLWDPSDPNYFKKNLKADAWTEIGKAMGSTDEICKKKMITLLSSFRREKAKVNKSQGTGKGTLEVYSSSWFAFPALAFIMDRDKPRKRIDTVACDNDNEADEDDGINGEATPVSQPPKKVPKQDQKLAMLKEAFGLLKAASTTSSSSNEPDEIKSFLSFVENKMRRYNENTKNNVQQAICEIIFRADNGCYDQNDSGNIYSYGGYAQPTYRAPMSQPVHTPQMTEPTYSDPKRPAPSTFIPSREILVSPSQITPPRASPSPSPQSTCSEVSNDFNINDFV